MLLCYIILPFSLNFLHKFYYHCHQGTKIAGKHKASGCSLLIESPRENLVVHPTKKAVHCWFSRKPYEYMDNVWGMHIKYINNVNKASTQLRSVRKEVLWSAAGQLASHLTWFQSTDVVGFGHPKGERKKLKRGQSPNDPTCRIQLRQ